ncbi:MULTISPECIES: hypothetical protein [Bacillus]|uniref:hypothetical protein n=1 Tax=Bacillus TaxID=1386 RepID=UPI00061804D0|nr:MULTISPECIES: hypothetical protein [Bacillus]KKB91517.1 hypothetical protein WB24_12805 [Bacillus sp. CMAA 1185]MBC9025753.1 hypothetical protein [Bacillus subtilis]MCH4866944.1 hypothetical protein [Bacillus sp. 1006-3]MCJ2152683.1 hypothetical protein [Bacillus subtilis]MCR4381232.1 hypothetical protein [Bacillus subtilis]
MNQYKFTLLSGVVFRKDISGVCYTELGSNSLPLGKNQAVNLLADEVIGLKEIIEENKRQQEVTVHQFRQTREELQRLNKENDKFRKALHQFADMKNIALSAEYVIQRYSEYALQLLNDGELEGDAK